MKKLLVACLASTALVSGASAADLGVRRVAVPAAIVAPSFSWTGFYAGLNVGLGSVNTNLSALTGGNLAGTATAFVGGGQIGYNHQINNIVLGIEGDLGYFGAQRRGAPINFGAFAAQFAWRTTWDASIRGRLGVAVDRTLLYVTGGVAFADLRVSQTDITNNIVLASQTQVRAGWTVGAGVEHALTPNWTVRAEYLYANYGSRTIAAIPGVSMQTHKVRLGVNYLFSTGPSAIVARY
ncbi:porin family protein [Phreatobacter aquaticus]|uniref:Porin family protein n=1 Tax=Phreatobacter aquaticus TaxID=2570229 RepID=A0A4D7QML4_9HYPH|nr:outer membrane protein [Phreatobacter aquaticus]QCK86869.1 porin family protein [Phreatobacter aquaticus]